ncbi:MAG: SLBB domain-containing protein [Planctomycetota bacterium]|nr:SLBB domain-containing protein [Planctomycetota bacterium]MDA1211153.1 SLBB domain-containing protein [Planctomycetota bacterium]
MAGDLYRSLWRGALLFSILLTVVGCSGRKYYSPEQLPEELVAHPQVNPRGLDLSKLAASSLGNDKITPGDRLEVTISAGLTKDDIITVPVGVDDHGNIQLPEIPKPIQVGGFRLDEAERLIAVSCVHSGLYISPTVSVTMKERRLNTVSVLGAVNKQGIVKLPRTACDLLSVLAEAGGLSDDAGTTIEVRSNVPIGNTNGEPDRIAGKLDAATLQAGHSMPIRSNADRAAGGSHSTKIDLVSATQDGSTFGYNIPDGSTVIVEQRVPQPITVQGRVRFPGVQEYPTTHSLRLLDAIALGGGVSSPVASRVIVIRPNPADAEHPVVVKTSLNKAKHSNAANVMLAPGDTVYVEQTPATVLLDAVQIIRFAFGASLGTLL